MEAISIILLLIAGLGAGVITGFIGASAVAFMAGLLILFTSYTPYFAIGLALLTDFIVALVCIGFYKKSKNIDIRHGLFIAIIATIFSLVGGFISRFLPHPTLGNTFGIIILITGINFMANPLKFKNKKVLKYFKERKLKGSILFGIIIGITSGIFGVGGGITILLILLYIFDYPLKKAIGTAIFIMAFIALAGGAGHFIGNTFPLKELIFASIGGIAGAIVSSRYSNKLKEKILFKIVGVILILLALAMIINNLI